MDGISFIKGIITLQGKTGIAKTIGRWYILSISVSCFPSHLYNLTSHKTNDLWIDANLFMIPPVVYVYI